MTLIMTPVHHIKKSLGTYLTARGFIFLLLVLFMTVICLLVINDGKEVKNLISFYNWNKLQNYSQLEVKHKFPTPEVKQQVSVPEAKDQVPASDYLVPNKVHYIWYAEKRLTFTFQQYLSILSVSKFQKPEMIYYHTNNTPTGSYWDKTFKIPNFKVVSRGRSKKIFGFEIKKAVFETSDSDISRVKVLLEEGGIYLDTDVWLIQSLDPLRKYECVLGAERENPLLLGGSIILASKNSAFIKLWMEHYLFDYQVNNWAYNSGKVPTQLAKQYPNIIHIESTKLLQPSWERLEFLYGNKSYPWRENYTLHLYRMTETFQHKYNYHISPESIKSMKTTYGQVAGHIYNNGH